MLARYFRDELGMTVKEMRSIGAPLLGEMADALEAWQVASDRHHDRRPAGRALTSPERERPAAVREHRGGP